MDELISRQALVDAIYAQSDDDGFYVATAETLEELINGLPTVPSEIIRCKDCVKHNKGYGYYYDGTVIGIKDCCPLVEIRGRAQGHEFDYQFCAYAERRTDG